MNINQCSNQINSLISKICSNSEYFIFNLKYDIQHYNILAPNHQYINLTWFLSKCTPLSSLISI